jgi:hypothetical protein
VVARKLRAWTSGYQGANYAVPVDLMMSYTESIDVLEVPEPSYPARFIPASSHRMSNCEGHYNGLKAIRMWSHLVETDAQIPTIREAKTPEVVKSRI